MNCSTCSGVIYCGSVGATGSGSGAKTHFILSKIVFVSSTSFSFSFLISLSSARALLRFSICVESFVTSTSLSALFHLAGAGTGSCVATGVSTGLTSADGTASGFSAGAGAAPHPKASNTCSLFTSLITFYNTFINGLFLTIQTEHRLNGLLN